MVFLILSVEVASLASVPLFAGWILIVILNGSGILIVNDASGWHLADNRLEVFGIGRVHSLLWLVGLFGLRIQGHCFEKESNWFIRGLWS